MSAYDVILRPVITEQSMDLMDENKYTFEVDVHANKTQVKQAIEEIYGVDVKKVNIVNVHPKPKRMGRYVGNTKKRRKAIVKVAEDQSIAIFNHEDNEE